MTDAPQIAAIPWRSALLASLPGVSHAVTRRVPGMGLADGNIGYSAPRDKADAWAMRQRWCAAAGLDAGALVTLGQVHGADVHVARRSPRRLGCDAGFDADRSRRRPHHNAVGPVLMTLHADCQPLLFVAPARDRRGPVVAVAHAGWRGTVADVGGQTIAAMAAAFGTRAADVFVALGPAIGPCCYEVGAEVEAAWRGAGWIRGRRRAGTSRRPRPLLTPRGERLAPAARRRAP